MMNAWKKQLTPIAILAIIIFIGFLLRLILALKFELWIDEVFYLTTARANSLLDLILQRHWLKDHPQFYLILVHFWSKVFTSPLFLRFPTLLASIFSHILIFLIVREVLSPKAALIATFIYAFSHFYIALDWQATPYGLETMFILLSIYFLIKMLFANKRWLIGFVIANVLGFYTDYSFIWYFGSLWMVFLLSLLLKTIKKQWVGKINLELFGIGLISSFLLMVPQIHLIIANFNSFPKLSAHLGKPNLSTLQDGLKNTIGIVPRGSPLNAKLGLFLTYIITFISMLGLIYFLRPVNKNPAQKLFVALLLILFLLPPAISYAFSTLVFPIFVTKTFLASGFFLNFSLAYLSTRALEEKWTKIIFTVSCLCWLLLSLANWSYQQTYSDYVVYPPLSSKKVRDEIRTVAGTNQKVLVTLFLDKSDWRFIPLRDYYLPGLDENNKAKIKYDSVIIRAGEEDLEPIFTQMDKYDYIWLIKYMESVVRLK